MNPPLDSVLEQFNPVHSLACYSCKTSFNNITSIRLCNLDRLLSSAFFIKYFIFLTSPSSSFFGSECLIPLYKIYNLGSGIRHRARF